MEMVIRSRYVHFPVKNGAEKVVFRFLLNGEVVREFDVEFAAEGDVDWWAFYDVSAFQGKEIQVQVRDEAHRHIQSTLPGTIEQSDEIKGAGDLYRERHRPQLHFTSRRGWNNDPNGMVYYDGEYHLFYQHNPFGIGWGNMHWGHAVSTNLAHWRELPIALYQQGLDDMAFSGGATVDAQNTAGFRTGREDVIVATFTSTGRGECLAYSNDKGRRFTDYEGNPVIEHRGRDPKVIWHEPQRKWVMIVYDETNDEGHYAFYDSEDLKSWRFMSALSGFFECPELFEMPLDGDENARKWVVYGAERHEENGRTFVARSSYQVGRFDGHTFTPETAILDGHLGPNYYAAQTFSNFPDDRRVMMGWLSGADYPGMPFSQGMTVPLELALRTTAEGPRLFFYPVEELDMLREQSWERESLSVSEANQLLKDAQAELLDLIFQIEPGNTDVTLDVRGVPVSYDAGERTLIFRGKSAPLEPDDGVIELRVLVDRCVLEVFGNEGRVAFSAGGDFLGDAETGIHLTGGDAAQVRRLAIHRLRPIWR